jgi:S1-C subfamily serine protease
MSTSRSCLEASLFRARLAALALLTCCLASASAPAGEKPPTGWLGVLFGNTQVSERDLGADKTAAGVPIQGVVADSPAARAGLRARDRIVAVDTVRVSTPQELMAAVTGMEPGRWVSLTVERRDDSLHLDARLTERPSEEDMKRVRVLEGWIGVEAIDLPQGLRRHFGAPEGAGVMVSNVLPASPAEAAGLRLGDVVFDVDGVPVASEKELRIAVVNGGIGNQLELTLMRDGSEITVDAMIVTAPEVPDEGSKPR